jgi:hypothetical protein
MDWVREGSLIFLDPELKEVTSESYFEKNDQELLEIRP